MSHSRVKIRPILVVLLLAALPAWPQASNSTVRGVVRDQTNAFIPGATVTLANTNTNVSRTVTTNEAGAYVFPGVIPGPYRLTAESAGMQNFEGNLTVQVQQDATVDAVLRVGQTASEVVVQDVTPLLRADSPSIGHVLERKRIESLPINGRAITALLQTVPGVETGMMRAYGMRQGTMLYVFDGTQHNESWEGWAQQRPPGIDAVEEFKVEINSASAKFSRPATLIVSSRSGTNQFHGALFETNRNNAIGKARQRQDTYTKAPYLNRNEFGASAGGPVYLPGIYNGRNRTFFFSAWEASRQINPSTMQWRVPTEAMRNGDFRSLVDSQGRLTRLYDPWTTNPETWQREQISYRGIPNMIDPARLSPVTKALWQVTPLPTMPEVNPLVDVNWSGLSPNWNKNWTWSTRIDHRLSGRDNFFARYTQAGQQAVYQYAGQIMLDQLAGAVNRRAPNKAVSGTWVHTFSPTLFSETMVSVSRDNQTRGNGDFRTDYSKNFGLPNPFGAVSYPEFTGTGLSGYGYYRDTIFDSPSWYVQVQENATKVVGRHELQFGFHYRYDRLDMNNYPPSTSYTWSTLATALYDPSSARTNPLTTPFTGSDIGNMYLGVMNFNTAYGRNYMYYRGNEYSPYLQDNWKVTPRLTLNLGLRYELRPPVREKNDAFFGFSMRDRAYVVGAGLDTMYKSGALLPQVVRVIEQQGGKVITYKEAGMPQALVNTNWKNFGPRLGFAYRAGDGHKSFVLRGGYRISTYPIPLRSWGGVQGWNPPSRANFTNSLTNTAQSPDGIPSYGLRSVPRIVAGVNSATALDVSDTRTLARGFASASFRALNVPDGRVQDWNLTVEKDVLPATVLRLSYVGNYSGNQEVWVRHNESTPSYIWFATTGERLPTGEFANVATRPWDKTVYASVNEYTSRGWSRFNGIQVEFERRYEKGYAYQFFYLMGNTLFAGGKESNDFLGSLNTYMPGRVPADLDDRTRFLLYRRDIDIPKHRVRWNFVADLPVGKGKPLAGGASGWVDKLVGGWQLAGMGSLWSNFFTLPTNIYPANANTIERYGYKYPIEDCRSGRCVPGYLWWNGYIPANQINSYDRNGRPNGVMGVPDSYKPAAEPLIPWPKNPNPSDPMFPFYGSNTAWVRLRDGSEQRTTFDDGLHPWRNQFLPGIRQWGLDASLFKFVNLTERVVLRVNVDMFNVLNHPNNPNSIGGDGILSTRNSGSGARTTQLTLRLQW
jgi:hypothetical protein